MKLIKQAIVYKAELPKAELLRQHLAERPFAELTAFQENGSGFVEVDPTHEMVAEFEGGVAFSVRYDSKVVPASAIKRELKKISAKIEGERGHAPGKKQLSELKEVVRAELIARAVPRTAIITSFYDIKNGYLIVPVGSKALADVVTGNLIQAVGSMKTETIHVSNVKHGLTTRLKEWLESCGDERSFGVFYPCDAVSLKRDSERVSMTLTALESATQGLKEAMEAGFEVDSMGFSVSTTSFRLTSNFHFKSIRCEDPEPLGMSSDELWRHEAAVQMFHLSSIVQELCALLAYQEPEAEAPAEEGAEAL